MAKFVGVAGEIQRLQKELERLEQEAALETQKAAGVLMDALLSRTPVWSGEVAINYNAAHQPARVLRGAPGPGEPGTNKMPLGSERNRSAAEAPPRASVAGLGKDELKDVYITNDARNFDLVESGAAPAQDRARNPGGVSKIAVSVAKARLEHWK